MVAGRLVFSQVMDFVPWRRFAGIVEHYGGDHRVRRFSCRDQFLCMTYAQMSGRESLRDIETCLGVHGRHLYHMGFRGRITRATLADANESRNWRIHADVTGLLIDRALSLYRGEGLAEELRMSVYALDSTIIDLCLSLYPWTPFQHNTAAIKLHTLLDLSGSIPAVLTVSRARVDDRVMLDQLIIEPGAIYIMDRGFLDFARLYRLHLHAAFFVIRPRKNTKLTPSGPLMRDPANHILADQRVRTDGQSSRQAYPEPLRRVIYKEPESGKVYAYLSNNMILPPATIARLYKDRWQVELFFKWIKQNLRLRHFLGQSPNAVKTQIWIAVATYLLIAIAKKHTQSPLPMQAIRQILNVALFERTPLNQLLRKIPPMPEQTQNNNQLNLFKY